MGLLYRKDRFPDWLEKALREVRFAPDRKRIGAELTAHYEDRFNALIDCGCTPAEAEARALEALGDAAEVGRELDRVHHFWLGVLWMASRVLAAALALLVLVTFVSEYRQRSWVPALERSAAQLSCTEPPPWAASASIPGGRAYLTPRKGSQVDKNGNTVYEADLWLETRYPIPKFNYQMVFTLADQTGDLPFVRFHHDSIPTNYGEIVFMDEELGWSRQHGTVSLHLDHAPEFLELTQPYGEEPWSIRCEWEVTP